VIGQYAACVTERLGIFIAYRTGFVAPPVLARQFATLDQLSKGRVSFNVITGAEDKELARDGNLVADKDQRYTRTNEFLDVVRLEWTSREPFTYRGKYYQVENGFSLVKPYNDRDIDIYVGGASDAAVEVAGRHADIFCALGRDLRAGAGCDGARACGSRQARAQARIQPLFPADSRRHRG
jgi:alkanesulfonate monooxygenase